MEHILCLDTAPLPIYTLLEDLYRDPQEQDAFIAMVVESTTLEGFKFIDNPLEGHEGCTLINAMLSCLIMPEETRREFLLEEQPQADFEPDELASWEGMVLAVQFATNKILRVLIDKLPEEFISYGIHSLPAEEMRVAAQKALRPIN